MLLAEAAPHEAPSELERLNDSVLAGSLVRSHAGDPLHRGLHTHRGHSTFQMAILPSSLPDPLST
jgi:hypothetical protein